MLIGNVATGKSTTASKLYRKGFYIISLDGFRRMLGGGDYVYDRLIEHVLGISEHYLVENLMNLKINIVIDDAKLVNSEFRKSFISLAKKYGYIIECIVMPSIPMKTAVDRRLKNNYSDKFDRKLWESVYQKFELMTEKPLKSEGINKISNAGYISGR